MLKHSLPRHFLGAVALVVLLSACKVDETIDLHADGSGTYRAKVSVSQEFAEALGKLKQEATAHGLRVLDEGQSGNERFVVVGRDFSQISELNDKDTSYSFLPARKGLFTNTYAFDAVVRENLAASGFQRVLRLHMPGRVAETNAPQPSSDEVEWDCSQPGSLHVVASGFALPTAAQLSATVDRWFTRDELLFVRDGALWSAAPDGSDAKSSGLEGLGTVSVAETGSIVYDRFSGGLRLPLTEDHTQDLNIYLLEGGVGAQPRQLTADGQSIRPVFSPDGRSIVYQKFEWSGRALEGQGKGLWLYDVATGHHRELVGRDARANSGAPYGLRKWWLDEEVRWALDGQTLLLTRDYQTDGGGIYAVDYVVTVADGHTVPFDKYQPDGSYRAPRLALDRGLVLAAAWHGSADGLIEEDTATRQARMIAPGVSPGVPALSRDGSTIAFPAWHLEGGELWVVHRDGSELRRLAELPAGDTFFRPQWAPDGRTLVVTMFTNSGSVPPKAQIIRIDAQSGQQTILASGAQHLSFSRAPRLSATWLWLVKGALLVALALLATALLLWLRRLARRLRNRQEPHVAPAAPGSPRYCHSCGQALPQQGVFCVGCGTKFA